MNSKHVAYAFVAHDSEKYIARHETTSERYIACSNIPRSENTPAYVYHSCKLYCMSGIIFHLLIVSNMHKKREAFMSNLDKTLTILRGIMRIGATSERLITFSSIPRSENAPAYALCLYKSYYTSGILLWILIVSNIHSQYIQDTSGNKNKTNEKNHMIHRGTSWEWGILRTAYRVPKHPPFWICSLPQAYVFHWYELYYISGILF